MTAWRGEELDRIGRATEIGIASRREDGTLRPYITIWAVHAGDGLYVRSAYGPANPWFRRALQSGRGRIRAGSEKRDVLFTAPDAEVAGLVTAAYHTKYDRYGPAIVGSVVSAAAVAATLRVEPE